MKVGLTAGANRLQVSNGAVWSVGGLAPPAGAIEDGHGGLIQSGTNARVFTTSFSAARVSNEEEQEQHEARLASALDIDRAQRILDFKNATSSGRNRSRKNQEARLKQRKTYWNGTEWVKDGHVPSKSLCYFRKGVNQILTTT